MAPLSISRGCGLIVHRKNKSRESETGKLPTNNQFDQMPLSFGCLKSVDADIDEQKMIIHFQNIELWNHRIRGSITLQIAWIFDKVVQPSAY